MSDGVLTACSVEVKVTVREWTCGPMTGEVCTNGDLIVDAFGLVSGPSYRHAIRLTPTEAKQLHALLDAMLFPLSHPKVEEPPAPVPSWWTGKRDWRGRPIASSKYDDKGIQAEHAWDLEEAKR